MIKYDALCSMFYTNSLSMLLCQALFSWNKNRGTKILQQLEKDATQIGHVYTCTLIVYSTIKWNIT